MATAKKRKRDELLIKGPDGEFYKIGWDDLQKFKVSEAEKKTILKGTSPEDYQKTVCLDG